MAVTELVFKSQDNEETDATTTVYLNGIVTDVDNAAVNAGEAAFEGVSDNALAAIQLGPIDDTDYGTEAAGPYDDAEDKLEITGYGVNGEKAVIQFPAPLDTIFLSDKVTLDTANVSVAAFLGALCDTFWSTTNGNAIQVGTVTGRRVRTPSYKPAAGA